MSKDINGGRGFRMYRCESCLVLFICEQCTDAMVKAQSRVSRYRYLEKYYRHDSVIYSLKHAPVHGPSRESIEEWLCEECAA